MLKHTAPELAVSQWFNTDTPLTLASLRGRVVFLHTFQMLCPGCVSLAIPQAQKIEQVFRNSDLQVIGLHTVFEHHAAMTPVSLQAFLHEYRITHPVGVDQPDEGLLPLTMERYRFQGTPSAVIIGRDGSLLHHAFGAEDDMIVGARIASALSMPATVAASPPAAEGCAGGICAVSA
jgi:hypothetical protein